MQSQSKTLSATIPESKILIAIFEENINVKTTGRTIVIIMFEFLLGFTSIEVK